MLLLAYASSSAYDFTDGDLITLLMNSRANNRRAGITGLLLHDKGRFIQILEGESDVVRDRYTRIAADPRHRDISILLEQDGPDRKFPKWTMGYKALNDPLVQSIPGFNTFFTREATSDDSPIEELLARFRSGDALAASVESD